MGTTNDHKPVTLTMSLTYGVDDRLVRAVISVESGGDRWAWNPEPRYRWFWNVRTWQPFRPVTADEVKAKTPPPDFPTLAGDPDQEWWGQQASWGPMQVMGAVAREFGFRGRYLTELCDASGIGMEMGGRVLAARLKWANGDVDAALASYNGGPAGNEPGRAQKRNAAYVAKVRAALRA